MGFESLSPSHEGGAEICSALAFSIATSLLRSPARAPQYSVMGIGMKTSMKAMSVRIAKTFSR